MDCGTHQRGRALIRVPNMYDVREVDFCDGDKESRDLQSA